MPVIGAPITFKTTPMRVQREALKFGMPRDCWGLLAEMGLGKTMTAIYWALKRGFKRIAVLGRRDDLDTWADEIKTHTDADYVNICTVQSRAKRLERLRLWEEGTLAPFCLMTYDSVKQLRDELTKIDWECVIADEMTEIKHVGTARTKAVFKVFGTTPHRLGMTGTPVTNTPEDVFAQMKFIDGGHRFGTSFWEFRKRYFWPDPMGYQWYPFNDTFKRIRRKMYEVCVRFRKQDALDLPPKVFLRKTCGMTRDQQKVYDQVRDEFELTLKSGETVEFNYVVQQFTKLLQITGGFYYYDTPNGRRTQTLPCEKLRTLEWMLDLPEFRKTPKIVIWAAFNHELEAIRDVAARLGYHGVMFWKHTEDRKAARAQFRDDPNCQLFIGQVMAGIGMNELKVSDTVFYYSRSMKLVHRLQSEDRTHRKGSEIHRQIRYIDLVVPGTLDARVYSMLRRYRDIASTIVDGKSALEMVKVS